MSVLFCRIPDFLLALACRREPALSDAPVGLVGEDERMGAVSPLARESGVCVGMHARQARMRCPDLRLRPLDSREGVGEQQAFVAALARFDLPVEEHGWGAAWLDLHTLATRIDDVQPLAVEVGRRVRALLSDGRSPALGWDSSKFTARAAAHCAAVGTVRIVGKVDEARFLAPLPVSLLPLPAPTLQQLHWLGIRTLGQYAALPQTAVWQRFGQVGKLAQRWAQGKDSRPVCGSARALPTPITLELDPPSEQIGRVLAEAVQALHAPLHALAALLLGVRRLRVQAHFLMATPRIFGITFIEPASQPARVQTALAQQLQALVWPGALECLEIEILEAGELVAGQLTLFGAAEGSACLLPAELAARWAGRYGRCFFLGQIADVRHPVHERVYHLQAV